MVPPSRRWVLWTVSLLAPLVAFFVERTESSFAFFNPWLALRSRTLSLPCPSTAVTPISRSPRGNAVFPRAEGIRLRSALSTDCDLCLRTLAAEALLNVFYRGEGQESTVDAEKALRNCLRHLEKKNYKELECAPPTNQQERQIIRKRLSELILGTSIMRRRHWHTMVCSWKHRATLAQEDVVPGCEDIQSCVFGEEQSLTEASHVYTEQDIGPPSYGKRRLGVVRALVDLHASYLVDNNHRPFSAPVADRLSLQFSLPPFITRLWIVQYGSKQAEDLAIIANQPGPITIRRNTILCPSDQVLCDRLWKDHGVAARPLESLVKGNSTSSLLPIPIGCIRIAKPKANLTTPSIWSMDAWKDGWFEVQDAGSQVIVDAMEVSAGETVVDYCAGNGGKTLALASQLWTKGENSKANGAASTTTMTTSRIMAHDISEERLRQLRGSLHRLGLTQESRPQIDVCFLSHNGSEYISSWNGTEMWADAVLVDAPCSSLGVLRRRPGQRWIVTEEQVKTEFPALQLEILRNASRLVRTGGRLIYATCSIMSWENEEVVRSFEINVDEWERWDFPANQLRSDCADLTHCRSLLPNQVDCDGFFVARWKRK